jgi:hypothetical protein
MTAGDDIRAEPQGLPPGRRRPAPVTEAEAVPGGAIRVRHTVTNTSHEPYVVNGLEVVFPLPGRVGEVLDSTAGAAWTTAAESGPRVVLVPDQAD